MRIEMHEPEALWREDSAVWEIIAGELVLQERTLAIQGSSLLLAEGRDRAHEAARLAREGDWDNAGHAMIGCSLALAMAARAESPSGQPAATYAADFAVDIAWAARQPSAEDLDLLGEEVGRFAEGDRPEPARGIMRLAVRSGGYTAGLSSQITRRRQRRDLVGPHAAAEGPGS